MLVIMIGASRPLYRMYLVRRDTVSASQTQMMPRSSKSMFHARQGVVSEKRDSLRQLMPMPRILGSRSISRLSVT